jgi:hypothetical protein
MEAREVSGPFSVPRRLEERGSKSEAHTKARCGSSPTWHSMGAVRAAARARVRNGITATGTNQLRISALRPAEAIAAGKQKVT